MSELNEHKNRIEAAVQDVEKALKKNKFPSILDEALVEAIKELSSAVETLIDKDQALTAQINRAVEDKLAAELAKARL